MHLAYPASLQAFHSNTYLKQIMQNRHNMIENLNWRESISWIFTYVADDLNSGRTRTYPASGESGTHDDDEVLED